MSIETGQCPKQRKGRCLGVCFSFLYDQCESAAPTYIQKGRSRSQITVAHQDDHAGGPALLLLSRSPEYMLRTLARAHTSEAYAPCPWRECQRAGQLLCAEHLLSARPSVKRFCTVFHQVFPFHRCGNGGQRGGRTFPLLAKMC